MESLVKDFGVIEIPYFEGKESMVPFDLKTLEGLKENQKKIASQMLSGIKNKIGTAFFTIHGRKLKKGETLRRPGPHTDGNYEPHNMTFGGGGWKVGENGPEINTDLHARQYDKELGGIILASNVESCLGWKGTYKGLPGKGGDCSEIKLDQPFMLERNKIYYGNNHFIHESLPVNEDAHRVFVRITLPENHVYEH